MATVGCTKYLDQKSDSMLVTVQSLSDLQGVLDDNNIMNAQVTAFFGEASSDNYFLLPATYTPRGDQEKAQYRWIPFDYRFPNDWAKQYNAIYNANICLDLINKIPQTDTNRLAWNNVIGSALFYRSYYYCQVAWNFAKAYDESTASTDLGIVLRSNSDFNVPSVRSSVQETYNQIISDAKASISYLQDNPQHVIRPSKAAAFGLLARVYLSMRQYDSAYKYSNLCLGIKNVLLDYNSIAITATVPFAIYNPEVIFHTGNTSSTIAAPSRAKVDTVLYATYAANDLRKTAFFLPVSGYQQFKGMYTGNGGYYFTGIAADEMYLDRAECLARAGNKDAALADLNTLLVKRWKTGTFNNVTATDAADALKKILDERRKELLFRGLRWIDIKRLNKEGADITLKRVIPTGEVYTLAPNSNYYALPIPRDVIEASGILQNPQ